MADARECPLCNGSMRLRRSETIAKLPGTPQVIKREITEWVCPDCDYFEEAGEVGA